VLDEVRDAAALRRFGAATDGGVKATARRISLAAARGVSPCSM